MRPKKRNHTFMNFLIKEVMWRITSRWTIRRWIFRVSSNTTVEEFSFISSFSLTENVSKLVQNFSTQLISKWPIVVSSKYSILQTLKEIQYIIIKRLRYPLFVGIIGRSAVIWIGGLDCLWPEIWTVARMWEQVLKQNWTL